MKPPTSNSSQRISQSFLVTTIFLPFNAPPFCSPLEKLSFVLKSSHTLSCPFSQACIESSSLVPVFAAHKPNTFCTKFKASPVRSTILSISCPPKCFHPTFQHVFGVLSQPHWSFTCSLHFHVFAVYSASHTLIFVCCHTPLRSMLLCFPFSCSQRPIFPFTHQTVTASCILQC